MIFFSLYFFFSSGKKKTVLTHTDFHLFSCRKNSSFVLQNVLEKNFKYYAENFEKFNYKTTEALKILIRIYLMALQGWEEEGDREEDDEKYSEVLFQKYRPNYLNQVPPFSPELKEMFTKSSSTEEEKIREENKKGKMILYKLQVFGKFFLTLLQLTFVRKSWNFPFFLFFHFFVSVHYLL